MPKKINYAHKIAEIICRRYFDNIGFKDLPMKFWNDPAYSRDYHIQIIKASALLKLYSGPAIVAALETKEGGKIYSLHAPWLDQLISREQKKIDVQNRRLQQAIKKQAEINELLKYEGVELIKENSNPEPPNPDGLKQQSLFDKLN